MERAAEAAGQEMGAAHETAIAPGMGVDRNMAPVFRTTGWWVWAGVRDERTAWSFPFNHGCAAWDARINSCCGRAFGVRPARG